MRILTSRFQRVGELAYSHDGATLYGCGPSWDVITLRPVFGFDCWNLGGDGESTPILLRKCVVRRIVPLPDGRAVVGGTDHDGWMNQFQLWGAGAEKSIPLGVLGLNGHAVALSPDTRQLLVSGESKTFGGKRLLDSLRVAEGTPLERLWRRAASENSRTVTYPFILAFHPEGSRVLSCEKSSTTKTARWRSAADGSPLDNASIRLPARAELVRLVADGARLLVIDKTALLSYDLVQSGADPLRFANRSRKKFTGLAAHPDGRRVYVTSDDGVVREYDAVTLQELRAWGWKVGKLLGVAVAPDGLTAAVGSDTGKVVVWDLE